MEETNNNLSSVLTGAMRNKGVSIEKVSHETGISERFILLLLEEDFKHLPATPYLHGYVVKISEYLGLDGEELWSIYFKNSNLLRKSGSGDKLPENRFNVPSFNKKFLVILLVIVIIPLYFILRSTFSGNISNNLVLSNLEEDITVVDTPNFLVRGELEGEFTLTLNGSQVFLEEDGTFESEVSLEPGFNTLNFSIEGPLNKEDEVIRQVFFESEESEEDVLEENEPETETESDDLILPSPGSEQEQGNTQAPLF